MLRDTGGQMQGAGVGFKVVDRTYVTVAAALESGGVRFLLAGGFAVNAHGFARGTEDIDLVVPESALHRADTSLQEAGFRCVGKADVVSRYAPPPGMRFVVDVMPLDDGTFDALWRDAVAHTFQGREVRVPSLDHLLAMKIHAMRNDSMTRGLKDLLDIVGLARANGLDAASERLRALCDRFGNDDIRDAVAKALSS